MICGEAETGKKRTVSVSSRSSLTKKTGISLNRVNNKCNHRHETDRRIEIELVWLKEEEDNQLTDGIE